MRQALQTHENLWGHLNFSFSLIRAKSDCLPNHPEIAIQVLQDALYEALISQIRFFGVSNLDRLLTELEKRFAKRSESSILNNAVSIVYQDAGTERKVHGACRIQDVSVSLAALRSTQSAAVERPFAANYERKGCEGFRNFNEVAQVRRLHPAQPSDRSERGARRSPSFLPPGEKFATKENEAMAGRRAQDVRAAAALSTGCGERAARSLRSDGGWKWKPNEGGAATIGAVAGAIAPVYGAYAAEYINKQSFGDEYSSYDQMGVNTGVGSTIGAYIGAIAAAVAMESAGDSFLQKLKEGELGEAAGATSKGAGEAARKLAETQQTASIFQGAGYSMGIRRFAHQIGRSIEGIGLGVVNTDGFTGIGASIRSLASTAASGLLGGAFNAIDALSGVSERVGNFFSGKGFNTDSYLVQAREAYDQQMLNSLDDTSRDNAAQKMRESGLYTDKEIEQMKVASAVIGMQERQIGATTYDWQDNRGKTTTRYANLAGKLAKEGNRTVLEQMQLDAFANFPEEMIKNGITDPTKISPEQANSFAEQIQQKIYAGEPVRHFAGAGYTAQTHDAFALSRAAHRVGLTEAQAIQGAARLSLSSGELVTPSQFITTHRVASIQGLSAENYGPAGYNFSHKSGTAMMIDSGRVVGIANPKQYNQWAKRESDRGPRETDWSEVWAGLGTFGAGLGGTIGGAFGIKAGVATSATIVGIPVGAGLIAGGTTAISLGVPTTGLGITQMARGYMGYRDNIPTAGTLIGGAFGSAGGGLIDHTLGTTGARQFGNEVGGALGGIVNEGALGFGNLMTFGAGYAALPQYAGRVTTSLRYMSMAGGVNAALSGGISLASGNDIHQVISDSGAGFRFGGATAPISGMNFATKAWQATAIRGIIGGTASGGYNAYSQFSNTGAVDMRFVMANALIGAGSTASASTLGNYYKAHAKQYSKLGFDAWSPNQQYLFTDGSAQFVWAYPQAFSDVLYSRR